MFFICKNKIINSFLFCLLSAFVGTGQTKINLQLLPITHNGTSEINQWVNSIQSNLIEKIVAHPSLALVERDKIGVLHQEKELQKSEDFIDGKVVAQGKASGAQFILSAELDVTSKVFRLKAIDVEKENIATLEKCDIAEILKWLDDDFTKIDKAFERVTAKIAATKRIKVLRFNNPKQSELLIAVGQNANIKKKQMLSLYILTNEKIEDDLVEREVTIGKAKIIELQGDNFSVAEISGDNSEIIAILQKGTKIFCKIQ